MNESVAKAVARSAKIIFLCDYDLVYALENYIIDNDLDRTEDMNLSKFINKIVKEWCEVSNYKLEDDYLFYGYKTKGRKLRHVSVFFTPDDKLMLNRTFVKNYIRSIKSINMFVANIIEQWTIKNIEGYKEIFENKFIENEEIYQWGKRE